MFDRSDKKVDFGTTPNIIVPRMPVFKSVQEERLHRQTRLVAGFRLLGKFGYDEGMPIFGCNIRIDIDLKIIISVGVAGHLTCRDPQYPDLFW